MPAKKDTSSKESTSEKTSSDDGPVDMPSFATSPEAKTTYQPGYVVGATDQDDATTNTRKTP